jgi:hypothetical protein
MIAFILGTLIPVLTMAMPSLRKTASKAAVYRPVAVADEVLDGGAGVPEVHHKIPGQLRRPACGGMRGDAENMDAAGGVLDGGEDVQPAAG